MGYKNISPLNTPNNNHFPLQYTWTVICSSFKIVLIPYRKFEKQRMLFLLCTLSMLTVFNGVLVAIFLCFFVRYMFSNFILFVVCFYFPYLFGIIVRIPFNFGFPWFPFLYFDLSNNVIFLGFVCTTIMMWHKWGLFEVLFYK